jgi:uncharacterized protein YgiM (DUF1202 family)
MAKVGVTTGNLKLRSGPGMEFNPPLDYLKPDTKLDILGEEGKWLHVKVQGGKEGYVGSKYVKIIEDKPTLSEIVAATKAAAAKVAKPEAVPDVKPAGMPEEVWQQLKKK